MTDLLIGIVSSIVAAILIAIFVQPIRRGFLIFYFAIIKNKELGIKYIYSTRDGALRKIDADLMQSQEIMAMNFKGYSLLDNVNFTESKIYKLIKDGKVNSIKYLILNPESEHYIHRRGRHIKREGFEKIDINNSKKHIERSIDRLKQIHYRNDIKKGCYCRFFDEELKWNLLFSDKYVLVGFYAPGKIAHRSPCMIIKRKGSLLGNAFEQYFEDIWANHSINAYVNLNMLRSVYIASGSFQGKSLVALNLAAKYNFSGVLTTDMIRNFLKIQNPDSDYLSTSTYKLSETDLQKQREAVSLMLENQLEIYKNRGEKVIIEGMHFTEDFIKKISHDHSLKIFLNNSRPIEERINLKQKTRLKFSIENELEYSALDPFDPKATAYFTNQNRIKEIHENLKEVCIKNGFTEVTFDNLNEAIIKCEKLIEQHLTKETR